jgi:hypothetical protein
MADETVKTYAGTPDISAQFTIANIHKTLDEYKQIKQSNGDYKFGELTALFYNFDTAQRGTWQSDIDGNYPKDVQNEIKRHIIHALTHKDRHGHEKPIPLSITWDPTAAVKSITSTYDPSGPSYAILISGFRAPLPTTLAERRAKYKKS